ncbi:antibiotic biosynthesis monooxygenase [Bacillus sp. SA1-12]|uniref:antibiotic biosynthesis monooxygenase family protein n=1 Tax=Bacillus sp. SA1-12 TaxID=1455638 RepID=UPI00062521FA|nr:antibiotic biosynthesis monooxygenase [Bacillus sp. SA1-12]KKI94070.1 antibiotic biosynthesis monooxygenase [Bacillus sp. SA1-12]
MFVNTAVFEIEHAYEERLVRKHEKDKLELGKAKGLLNFECWRRENKDTVEFVYVSKWESQDAFKAWISREEHVNEHKEINKRKKENTLKEQVKMKKTIRGYELYEGDSSSPI